jgi:type II secretory pathway pseudopilin PulG
MKLSRKAGLIVVIVVFAVALGVLFYIYSGQNGERADLNERLSFAQTLLNSLVDNRETKEDELTQAESLLAASQAQFPESVQSIEYDDDLFEIAEDCNVSLTKVTASKPISKTVGAVTYSISSFVVVVYGSIDNIMDFIYAIRTGDDFQLPWSAEVTSMKANVSGGSADINLIIYGYKG